ncbi:MAG: TIGR02302 family protein [Pseudomonadota bacterium]
MAIFGGGGLRGSEMRKVQRQLRLTRLSILSENIAQAFWPAFAVLCLSLAIALLGGYAALGPLGHRILLVVLILAFAAALIWGGNRFRRPSTDEITDRLDQSDPRRPLSALRDDLAVGKGQKGTETVWRTFRDRARIAAVALRAKAPDLRVAHLDTWGLRLLAPALLIGGLLATGGSWPDRIAEMTSPAPLDAPTAAAVQRDPMAEAWATPPAYTGLPTVYLDRHAEGAAPIELPQGSEITVRVTDLAVLPELAGDTGMGLGGFTSLGGGLSEATGVLAQSGTLTVSDGSEQALAEWQITMIPDAKPEIELDGTPEETITRSLSFGFNASDDYGVAAAWAEIAPEGHDPENAKGLPLPVISFGLPLPITGDARDIGDVTIRDFTDHPWAGSEVVLELFAEDGAEQTGQSKPITLTLPERRFSHPLARALVEQRRELALDYSEAGRVLDVLQAVTRRPEELFDDPGAYLGIRTAIRRLAVALGTETVPDSAPDVIEMLWRAALSLEDGDLSSALERLRQAQEALREALANGTEEDIRRAMDELRAAMNEYLQQLAQQQRNNPNQQQGQMDPNQMMSQQDLQEMLDRMQEQAEGGMRDQAREMLNQLSQMLENLQMAQQGQQGQNPNQQAMQELQDMIQRQRDLSDKTHNRMRQRQREQQLGPRSGGSQRGQQGQQQPGWGEGQGSGDEHGQQGQQGQQGQGEGDMQSGQPGSGGLAQEQEALRQQLENLARGLGSDEAVRALEEAVRNMGDARDDLQRGANSDAVQDQADALNALNEGAEALNQEIQNGQGDQQAQGARRGQGQGQDADRTDPFDRPSSSFGALDGNSTRVPDRALIDRARRLMEELRRRAAEPSRPQLELEYLDRLMDRF